MIVKGQPGYLEEELIIDCSIDYAKQVDLFIIHIRLVGAAKPPNIETVFNLDSD